MPSTSTTSRPFPRQLAVVVCLGIALRLVFALLLPRDAASIDRLPDQREYLTLGRQLLHHHTLSMPDPHYGQTVYAYRTPGYPLFIAACGGSVLVVRLMQVALSTATMLLVYPLARRWLTSSQATLATALVAFNPFLVYFTGLLLTETLVTTIFVLGVYLLTDTGRHSTLRVSAALILLASSVLIRPSGLLLPVVVGPLIAALNRERGNAYRTLGLLARDAFIGLVATAAILTPWAIRSHRVLHAWIWTATDAGITRYDGFNPGATGASDQRFASAQPHVAQLGEVERDRYWADAATRWAREHPLRCLRLAGVKVARTWSPVPLSGEFGKPLYTAIGLAFALPFDLLLIVGLFRRKIAGGIGARSKLVLALMALYFTLVHALTIGSLRYRVPSEPLLAVIAASALGYAGTRRPHSAPAASGSL